MSQDPTPYGQPTVPAAELMAYRLVSQSIEHGMVHVECSHDPSHACVCTWTERFIEHAAALFDEYARNTQRMRKENEYAVLTIQALRMRREIFAGAGMSRDEFDRTYLAGLGDYERHIAAREHIELDGED